jgi:photoactive yellow protein
MEFDAAALHARLADCSGPELDRAAFGAIGFDSAWRVRRYNRTESRFSGLSPGSVLGHGVFAVVVPCLGNELVARRFEAAVSCGTLLDVTLPYVLTWRMSPTPVRLRLLSSPDQPLHYVLVEHARPGDRH